MKIHVAFEGVDMMKNMTMPGKYEILFPDTWLSRTNQITRYKEYIIIQVSDDF